MSQHWNLAQFHWDDVTPAAVDQDLLETVKTAALVEANSADYVIYLRNVFADDEAFKAAADEWGKEEALHGAALARWAVTVDPSFDFPAALARFRRGYRLPLAASTSVRGSRSGELVARCVVESGTCSFYSAIRDHSSDAVLREICQRIAQDEARHYRLFETHLQRYLQTDPLSWLARLKVAWGRVAEADDDELAYAFYSANVPADTAVYERRRHANAYWRRAMKLYRPQHLHSLARMVLKAAGLRLEGRPLRLTLACLWWGLQRRLRRLSAAPH
ncbi:MAG: ferritin-like domain-containing protein [Gammaproteobacteria bacterium]|nr:ferritin-like domain-containing protein [Gammaproteobacteria bacterium]